jgi:ankyrin repeat protein
MRLYRGVENITYPRHFLERDSSGRRGITEYAFMSTTQSIDIALQYSGAKERKNSPTIFEIEVGSVDRGARISEFSQYGHEIEYLWAPGTFLEPFESRLESVRDCTVTVHRVRAKSNLKVMTIEELQSANKDMHLASFGFLIRDLRSSLERESVKIGRRLESDVSLCYDSTGDPADRAICTVPSLVSQIVEQCERVKDSQSQRPAAEFSVDRCMLANTRAMLDAVSMARSKLRGYLEDGSRRICFALGDTLRSGHREWTSYLRRRRPGSNRDEERRLCAELELIGDASLAANDLGETWLVAATADGLPLRDLRMLLSAGEDVNSRGKGGVTAVFVAAQYGHEDSLEFLLEERADPESKNDKGQTPLWVAARNGQLGCLRVLIRSGADVNSADDGQASPVWVAAQRGRAEVLRVLGEAGADPNAADDLGDSPALAAAFAKHAQCLYALIDLRANVGRANDGGYTPLMLAAASGSEECVRVLLERGSVDANAATAAGWSAAHAAASKGCAKCLALLHQAGADLHAHSVDGSPEEMAARGGHADCVELLLGLGRRRVESGGAGPAAAAAPGST